MNREVAIGYEEDSQAHIISVIKRYTAFFGELKIGCRRVRILKEERNRTGENVIIM